MREQTQAEQYLEAIRRINHLVKRPDGMSRTELIREVRRVTRTALKDARVKA